MANVNEISSNSYDSSSSIYGNRNVLSGLASGMDTETMIENGVSGYKAKITELQQKQEKLNWKTDAMRDIIDDAVALNTRYTSYTSSSNLYSEAFFDRNVTSTTGTNAGKVSATGRGTSTVTIDKVSQLATQAKYTVNASALKLNGNSLTASSAVDWDELTGSDKFGSARITMSFDGVMKSYLLTDLGVSASADSATNAAALKENLQKELNSAYGSGMVNVTGLTDGGALGFTVAESGNHTFQVAAGNENLGLKDGLTNYLDADRSLGTLLGEDFFAGGAQDLIINDVKVGSFDKDATLASVIKAIGNSDAGVTATFSKLSGEFAFTAKETGSVGRVEFGDGLASKLFKVDASPNSMTVGELLGDKVDWTNGGIDLNIASPAAGVASLGQITKDMKVQELIDRIDAAEGGFYRDMIQFNADDGSYSVKGPNGTGTDLSESEAQQFSLQLADGSGTSISFTDAFMKAEGGYTYTRGADSVVSATVNGKSMELVRSSNTIELDGLNVTVKELFEAETDDDKVRFQTTTDSEEIISTVKSFVSDYNALLEKIHKGFATMPAEKSTTNHTKYEPLTEKDKKDMSDSAVAAYEEKAKQGILYQDSDLSMLYNRLVTAVTIGGTARELESIGITSSFDMSTQTTKLEIDEEKLKNALEADPNKVSDLFTKSTASGASSNGLMATMKSNLDAYVSTSSAHPGALVKKAGTKLSSVSLLNNTWQDQLDKLQEKIESWQTKMSNRVDFYTKQYTALEKLISNMNNQSSMLMGLQGY